MLKQPKTKPSLLRVIALVILLGIPYFSFGQTISIVPFPQQINFHTGSHKHFSESIKRDSASIYSLNTAYDSTIGSEGYRLKIDSKTISVTANTPKGLFYGKQSVSQLLQTCQGDSVACLEMVDYPAYSYRGMHLDVSRHFFSKEFVKQYIDLLAAYKLNVFHWHLTDDQGWRIEIKKSPLLTEVGAWRIEKNGTKYGGYYTQDDIKEIVKYAAARFITIIPEIDLPGHSSAAIAAYPELSCHQQKVEVPHTFGIKKDIYCPTPFTFQFMEGVLDEVCTLFPSRFIHIGGDEVPKQQWKVSKDAQVLKIAQALKNEEELQHHFMKHIEDYLTKKGKRCIGWGEVVKGGLTDSMVVMSWRGKRAGFKAAKQGNEVVMTPRFNCYFDYPQRIQDPLHAIWMVYLPLKKVYRFQPNSNKLSLNQAKHILGGEATLWTEFVPTEKQAEHQLMPRLTALAESLWTVKENKNYKNFKLRLKQLGLLQ